MAFDRAFEAVASYGSPGTLDVFRRHLDPGWIDAALEATGVATLRKRRLPAEQVLWVVLGMAMFRDRPIEDVVSKLDLALPGRAGTIARSSIAQARERVGSEPLKWLFERTGQQWAVASAEKHRWRGLMLFGVDGSSVRVSDSAENREAFGGQGGRNETESGYPLVRIAVLMALRSHLLAAASFGPYAGSHELDYAKPLFEHLPPGSLAVLDRAYFSASLLLGIEAKEGRHWLTRAKSNLQKRLVKRLGPGDELLELEISLTARRQDPSLGRTWLARAIRYKRRGFPEQWLLTSLRDPREFPRTEIIALYHERWELELGYDEIKTEMLQRQETIRSRKPDGVRQELWGILLAYNLIRLEMASIAEEAKVVPTRISFIDALRLIRDEWSWLSVTSPGAIPKRIAALRSNVKRYVLPPRRARSYPRAVKVKMSGYNRKRPAVELAK
jgi:hypothetical protein